jgi:hypothetical protein
MIAGQTQKISTFRLTSVLHSVGLEQTARASVPCTARLRSSAMHDKRAAAAQQAHRIEHASLPLTD